MVKRKKLYTDASGVVHKDHPDMPEPTDKPTKQEREYWRIMEVIPDTPKYTSYQRLGVLLDYWAYGSIAKAIKSNPDIPADTIYYWKRRSNWWEPALRELREQKDDELDNRITKMIDSTLSQMEDRIKNGDVKVLKDGETVEVPISFRDLAIAGVGILYDKRALLRRNPTSITEHTNEDARLKKLAEQFKKIATRKEKVIEGNFEVISEEQNKHEQ